MEASTDQQLREQARKRLESKRDFRMHVIMYVLVNSLLVVIWAVTDAGFFWPIFPIAGWGIGLVADAYKTFGERPITDADIDREIDKLR